MSEFNTLLTKLNELESLVKVLIEANQKEAKKEDIVVNEERFLKPETAAKILDTTRQTLSKCVQKGHLKVYRFRTETRYSLTELLETPVLINR